MNVLVRCLMWPVIALLFIGGTHLVAEGARPALQDLIGPAVVMPIHLVAGGWAAYMVLRNGGSFWLGLLAGAILGREADSVLTTGIFGLFTIFWGGVLGAGIAASTRSGSAA